MTRGRSDGLGALVRELKRRRVFRVALAYGVVGWIIVQVAVNTFPYLGLPDWMVTAVIVFVVIGFPVALVLAWAFEITPEGVRRDEPAAERKNVVRRSPTVRVGGFAPPPTKSTRAAAPAGPAPEVPPDPQRLRRASLANLRHELRTPLNAILGYSEMLLEDADGDGRDGWTAELESFRRSARDLLSLLEERLGGRRGAEGAGGEGASSAAAISELAPAAAALLAAAQRLPGRAAAAGDAGVRDDLDRMAAAAARLHGLMAELAAGGGAAASTMTATAGIVERALTRLRPLPRTSADSRVHVGSLLVVDDNPINRDLLAQQLARQGFGVATAADGRKALETLRERDFDLVLLDVMMPEMDGIDVLEAMRADDALAEIPVIVVSALDEIDSAVRCIEMGAVDYLAKPFDSVLLRARIGATLEIRGLRAQRRQLAEELVALGEWADRVVGSLLPPAAADAVRAGKSSATEVHGEATALVVELQGTGTVAARGGANELVARIEEVIRIVDAIADEHATAGLWVGGRTGMFVVPANEDHSHAVRLGALALELAGAAARYGGESLCVGMGIHSGLVVAGGGGGDRVFGGYWGEGVELARTLACGATPGSIRVSPAAFAQLHRDFELESEGVVDLARANRMLAYRLTGRRGQPAPAR